MRRVPFVALLAGLILSGQVPASSRIIPSLPVQPLGVLVRDARAIHVLVVESVDPRGTSFKTAKALKGKPEEAPFRFAEIKGWGQCKSIFRAGAPVLCFHLGEIAALHVGGRWILAVAPIGWHGEEHWFCLAGHEGGVIYDGPTEVLRDHVAAILAGRQRIITARVPRRRGVANPGRLWRIQAGLKVTRSVESDESPLFVGWRSGEPDEVSTLTRALGAAEALDRMAAANDLAYLGSDARPALPALRRTLADRCDGVALAAARALALVDPDGDAGLKALQTHLREGEADIRAQAATILGEPGLRGRDALPALLQAVKDRRGTVRAAAATTLGKIAPDSPAEPAALSALTDLLRDGTGEGNPAQAAATALRAFGAHAWPAAPVLRQVLQQEERRDDRFRGDAMDLLARLSPPPVELLGEALADPRSDPHARRVAAEHLAHLGPRVRLALPRLRRGLATPAEGATVDIGKALLAIDPEGAPPLVVHALKKLGTGAELLEETNVSWLLGQCGAAGKPVLLALLPTLESNEHGAALVVGSLIPLLGPEDRKLLPQLRNLMLGHGMSAQCLPEILLRLGLEREALEEAALHLKSLHPGVRVHAARWLAARGRAARPVEAALRQALSRAAGAERVTLALALRRVSGTAEADARGKALAALVAMDRWGSWWQDDDFGEALTEVYARLTAADDVVAALARLLGDRNPHVRLLAAGALAGAHPEHPDLVPTLGRLLARYPDFFDDAEDTLAALGPRAQALAPVLVPLLRGEEEHYFAARDVLHRIDPLLEAKSWGAAGTPGAVPEDLTSLWDDLASADAFTADLAVWRLAGAGPRAVALVRQRLRPPSRLSPEQIAGLIADLDNDAFATREQASDELGRHLESVVPTLRKARAAGVSPEARIRIDRLLAQADLPGDPEQRRRLRAVRLLAEMTCPEAGVLLRQLAGDERFAPTLEAAGARWRLTHP